MRLGVKTRRCRRPSPRSSFKQNPLETACVIERVCLRSLQVVHMCIIYTAI